MVRFKGRTPLVPSPRETKLLPTFAEVGAPAVDSPMRFGTMLMFVVPAMPPPPMAVGAAVKMMRLSLAAVRVPRLRPTTSEVARLFAASDAMVIVVVKLPVFVPSTQREL